MAGSILRDAELEKAVVIAEEKRKKAMEVAKKKKRPSVKEMMRQKQQEASKKLKHADNDASSKVDQQRDEPGIAFSGKKELSESKKTGGSAFDLDEDQAESSKEEDEDIGITFKGKKKSSKKKNVRANTASGIGNINVSIKQDWLTDCKTSRKQTCEEATETFQDKKDGKTLQEEEDLDKLQAELGGAPPTGEKNQPVPEEAVDDKQTKEADILKSKKKKKKGGKTGEEEEDLDKILAEFGVARPVAPSPGENNHPEQDEAAGDKESEEAGPAESSAAKKKKKKKQKEKEKKEDASAPTVEKKQEVKLASGKKVPKHVREMQKRLAKIKEAEERQKQEEEEKKRKEEEEIRRKEEEERIAQERKRLKKDREKEKLLRKKQEGKLLTAKQKEEARRLEAMRNQILANAGLQLSTGAPAKRPFYQKKKKSKPQAQDNEATTCGSELDSVEVENVEELESSNGKNKTEATDAVEENIVNEEEWDAKSWDGADLKLTCAFADEKVESEPEPFLKKEIKNALTSTQDFELPAPAIESENGDVKNKISEAEVADKNNKKIPTNPVKKNKKVLGKDETSRSDEQNLRSPICCIMGHVDTGKTKLLDCIRGTNVQEGEAGGITQQIGATYIPAENICERTRQLKAGAKLKVPGLLVIDTPGHESFTNLRSRGSGLCDIAILVVDITHGLEPQSISSLNLLKMRNINFIVALNKVDRLYGWKTLHNAPITTAMKQQTKDVQIEFNMRLTQVITQFKEQGLNTELYYKNKEMGNTFSIVPTSAISGEGIPDLLLLLIQWAQKTMIERLTYSNQVQCTVLEVKVVEGHGTTVDVVLVNGVLHEGDQIVVCGLQGPIVTNIRALLTPHPMKELRVKGTYLHHKEIKAAQGIKISAQGLEHTIAGLGLYVVGPNDDLEDIKESAVVDMNSELGRIDKSGMGVYVQASTHGSLEALLEFLKSPAVQIPVSDISIGPVHKKDVMKASVMLEKKKEYGTILAFDVKVTPEARELADKLGVRIFCADIIYHLFNQFKAYINNLKDEKKKEASEEAVFPCVLKIIPNCVFNKKDPIVLGVDILEGIAKVGTPLCVPQKQFIDIGRIASIENNHRPVDYAKKGQQVAVKIIGSNPEEQQKMFGRHFEMEDELVSKISRQSLDALKEHYADELSVGVKRLLFKLKKLFKIA